MPRARMSHGVITSASQSVAAGQPGANPQDGLLFSYQPIEANYSGLSVSPEHRPRDRRRDARLICH
eukprot:3521783-Heterocapsa_arctica.AAC.1